MINLKTSKWIIKNIDTVIFDKDGTFIDLHFFWGKITELRALQVINHFNLENNLINKICKYLGYDLTNNIMYKDGITALYSRSKIIEIFIENLRELGINATIKDIEKIFDDVSNMFYENIEEYIKPIPEAIKLIKKLHKNKIKLAIVTSDSMISTNLALKKLQITNYFKIIIGRETSIYTKESGEPTKLALKELNSEKAHTVMIGDTPTDYISAYNAGINNVILVPTGQIDEKELERYSKYTVKNLAEIEIE